MWTFLDAVIIKKEPCREVWIYADVSMNVEVKIMWNKFSDSADHIGLKHQISSHLNISSILNKGPI